MCAFLLDRRPFSCFAPWSSSLICCGAEGQTAASPLPVGCGPFVALAFVQALINRIFPDDTGLLFVYGLLPSPEVTAALAPPGVRRWLARACRTCRHVLLPHAGRRGRRLRTHKPPHRGMDAFFRGLGLAKATQLWPHAFLASDSLPHRSGQRHPELLSKCGTGRFDLA